MNICLIGCLSVAGHLKRAAKHWREPTCAQRTVLLGNPDAQQLLRSGTQQEGQRFALPRPSVRRESLQQCLRRLRAVTRRSCSSPGGRSCSLSPRRASKLAQLIPPASRTYPTHLPRSLLSPWYRPRLEERERSVWFGSLAE